MTACRVEAAVTSNSAVAMATIPYWPAGETNSHSMVILTMIAFRAESGSFSALVARSVPRREVEANPDAKKSVLKEWDKLRAAGCWDEGAVREWADVAEEARRAGAKALAIL